MSNQKRINNCHSCYLGKCAIYKALKLKTTLESTLNALPTASKAVILCFISSTFQKQNQKNRTTTFKDTFHKDSLSPNPITLHTQGANPNVKV